MSILKVIRLSSNAILPSKATEFAAGYDLYSAYSYIIKPMENGLIETDIQVGIPSNCYGRIAPRSGLTLRKNIMVGAGVVDIDYRGSLKIVVFNFGKDDFHVQSGDRIAQFICEKIEYPLIMEVVSIEDTIRGVGGFGSTGL